MHPQFDNTESYDLPRMWLFIMYLYNVSIIFKNKNLESSPGKIFTRTLLKKDNSFEWVWGST